MATLIRSFGALLILLLLCSCQPEAKQLRLVISSDGRLPEVAQAFKQIVEEHSSLRIRVIKGEGSAANIARLKANQADLTLAENSTGFTRGIRSVIPMFAGVLHILHKKDQSPASLRELVTGKTVFTGAQNTMGELLLKQAAEAVGIPEDAYTIVDSVEVNPDVILMFGMINSRNAAAIASDYKFYSFGLPEELGRGSIVEALSLRYPQFKPFIIPKRTYYELNPEPVLTVRVDTLLVARKGLADYVVYELTQVLLANRQEFAPVSQALVAGISESIDLSSLTFPLHPGALSYLERNAPSLLERYAESIGLVFSISLALFSGIFAVNRWNKLRKKNRIDVYYRRALDIRRGLLNNASADDCAAASTKLTDLQNEAFELLIDERVAADESFRIFITLCQEIAQEIRTASQQLVGKN